MGYYVPDLLQNQRFNGLPLHLIQTSVRPVPSRATETQKNLFMNFSKKMLKTERPRHIIFILCESCWADKDNFQEVFKTLAPLNFNEVRAISPVFGGLTPNASFEILTGLPSDSDSIQGVIFQDYADLLKDEVLTIPQKLKQQGYKTIAMHNFHKRMWQREKVLKKFGFEKFVSLEDLDYQGVQMWPPDKILYDAALEVIKENRNDPLFLYLITVSTHGPYASTGSDDGEADYSEKLKVALHDLKQFITELNQLSKDPFIFVFSDHKPALPEYFKKRGLMDDQEKKGDVPVLIRDPSFKKKVSNVETINQLPFFCLIQKVDELYLNSKLPVFSFTETEGICQKNGKKYSDYKSSYPSWLYSLSLFEELPKPASTPPLRSSLDF